MNIHEYQAKATLTKYGVSIPMGIVADNSAKAVEAAKEIQSKTGTDTWAVKAQIHAGGRGKGGGVKIAKSLKEVKKYAEQIIGMNLITPQTGVEGKKVHKILVEQGVYFKGESEAEEFYMSILLNRKEGKNMIVYSTEGGMDIEAVAENTPHLIFKETVEPSVGFTRFPNP